MYSAALGRIPAPTGILVHGRLVAANTRLAGLFGYDDPEETVSAGLGGLFHEADPLCEARLGAVQLEEVLAMHRHGHAFSVRVDLSPARAGQRYLVVTDLSSQHAAQSRLAAVMEGSIQGVLVHRDMKPLYANDAYAHICGFDSAEEIMRMDSLLELIAPEDRAVALANYLARMRGEPAPTHYSYRMRRRDGRVIEVDCKVRIVDWDGLQAVQVTNLDVTEYREGEEGPGSRLARTADLAASMADAFWRHHQHLAAPLDAARNEAYLAGNAGLAGKLASMQDTLGMMRMDLERLLVTARQGHAVLQPVNLNRLVHDVLACRLRPASEAEPGARRLRYRTELEPLGEPVRGDPVQLREVLNALYDNAAEAMRHGGTITTRTRLVWVRPEEDTTSYPRRWVDLEVLDNGPGVAQQLAERVFEPFVTSKEGHAGLGLTAARATLQAHEASIALFPAQGRGARVRVRFPVARGQG